MTKKEQYIQFLKDKMYLASETGLDIEIPLIEFEDGTKLKPHQRDSINWAIKGGRRALFESFGLGKTIQQLLICWSILNIEDGKALIVCPLGVKQEFKKDAKRKMGIDIEYVRNMEEIKASKNNILITNYERVRDGDIDPTYFTVTSLDEASVLRSYGSETYQTFLQKFKGVKYKYVATATPSPNKYKELIHYAGYLEVMDTGQALTRFFKRDSTKANNLTIHPHKEEEFWLWMSSWALFLTKPSDLGYTDDGYDLPEMKIIYHELNVDHFTAGTEQDGQVKMFREAALGLKEASKEKKDSLQSRIAKMKEIIENDPDSHYIIWHDLESERHEIMKTLPKSKYNSAEVYGSQDLDKREQTIIDFSDGKIQYLATKPRISGSGCNFQYHCHKAIFLGVGYKFNDFLQALHRIYRFQQQHEVEIHIIYTESEREILKTLQKKWKQHNYLVEKMTDLIKQHGLSTTDIKQKLLRTINMERRVEKGKMFTAIMGDTTLETMDMKDDSVGLIVTSIPFSNHYEYTPTYNDYGHTDSNEHFWQQMDFLTPELYRVLQPGRLACIHIKDRVLFGNATGDGFPQLDGMLEETLIHFKKHGFRKVGVITIETDVVRENNQTYRLGWTEQCKDGSKMGVGCPEYVIIFRKLPTDTSKAYADVPVIKSKSEYTRGKWQIDARAKWNSSGERFLTSEELNQLTIDKINVYFKDFLSIRVYNYEEHVKIASEMEKNGKLPATFQTLNVPARNRFFVWDDVNRMLTLNSSQSRKKLTMHICLVKGSLILTKEEGYIPIETVKIGYHTLTHKGRWRKILNVKCTGINKTIEIKAQGVPNLQLTPNHKLWARKSNRVREREGAEYVNPEWLESEKSKGAYINSKTIVDNFYSISNKTLWIVGRWLADGHIDSTNTIIISCSHKEKDDLVINLGDRVGHIHKMKSVYQIRVLDKQREIKNIIFSCGKGASEKHLAGFMFNLSIPQSKSLLEGYLSGDGHFLKTRDRYIASSVSKKLALGISYLAQKVYNTIPSVYKGRPERISKIEGRIVNCKQDYIICFDIESKRRKKPFILDDGAWKKVRSIENIGLNETWNIKVEEDESYTAEGCIVKNCPLQFDIVDRLITRFSNKGETVYDPFAGIYTTPYRAVKLGRIGIGTELNPVSFTDGLRYMRAAELEYNSPTLFDLIELENEEAS